MPNDLWGSCGGGRFLVSEVPLYCDNVDGPRQALWYSSDRFRKFGIVFGTIGRLVAQTFWKYMEIHFQNTPTKGLACLISGCSTFALFHATVCAVQFVLFSLCWLNELRTHHVKCARPLSLSSAQTQHPRVCIKGYLVHRKTPPLLGHHRA